MSYNTSNPTAQMSSSRAEQILLTTREAIALAYLVKLKNQNDGPWYQNQQYSIRMEVTPDVIACAIQNNIEGALITEYGVEQGVKNAIEMLVAMLDADAHVGLSALGITVMDALFKSLAEMAYESFVQGKPLTATMNKPVH